MTLLLLLQIPVAAWSYRGEMTRSAYRVHGPDAPVSTLAAQIHQESRWKETARSWVGAQGLAQFMPATASDMARLYPADCAPANPFSPRWAFACRDRYMASLLRSQRPLSGTMTACDKWALGFMAYNGGGGWVNRARRKAVAELKDPDNWQVVRTLNPGRSAAAQQENSLYPEHIYRIETRYRSAGWGRGLGCF